MRGGGLMTLVHKNLKPVQIPMKSVSKMSENILIVEGIIGKVKVRFLNAYGVQENSSLGGNSECYALLDQDVNNCINDGILLCME